MNNIFENLGLLNDTGALTSIQVREIGTILPNQSDISILEFGSGITTIKLYDALCKKYTNVKYVTYEDNPFWAPKNPEIEVRMFSREELNNGKIQIPSNEKYDLIIVDGPDGEIRQKWYPLFKDNIKNGTIIHVDDAFHYDSFESELKKCFPNIEYIFEVGRDGWIITNKCWITVKITDDK